MDGGNADILHTAEYNLKCIQSKITKICWSHEICLRFAEYM